MSEPSDHGPTHTPYGQDPYGQPPAYGQSPYGHQPGGDKRPGTVTAAAWITIVLSGISAVLLVLIALAFVVSRDDFVAGFEDEWERSGAGGDLDIDAEQLAGVVVALFLFLALWALIALVLAVFVLRRSNAARILLVISSSVVALLSLVGIMSGVSIVTLGAALATIVLLFTGGAGDWFKRTSHPGTAPSPYGTGQYGTGYGTGGTAPSPYGQQQDPYGQSNPYGQPPSAPPGEGGQEGQAGQYGQSGQDGQDGGDHPPKDYPPRDYPGR